MEKQERIQRLEEDLSDAKKSLADADKEIEEAVIWKYKQMANVVEAFNRLEEARAEK